jgi:hypothetical protein
MATNHAASAGTDWDAQAAELVAKIHAERDDWKLPEAQRQKVIATREAVSKAPAELQVAFVKRVVDEYKKHCVPRGSPPEPWNQKTGVIPYAPCAVAERLLRKRLPFTDDLLSEMFESITAMSFLSLVGFIEPLVRETEKRAPKGELPPRTKGALSKIADMLLGRGLTGEAARDFHENWGFPARPTGNWLVASSACWLARWI